MWGGPGRHSLARLHLPLFSAAHARHPPRAGEHDPADLEGPGAALDRIAPELVNSSRKSTPWWPVFVNVP